MGEPWLQAQSMCRHLPPIIGVNLRLPVNCLTDTYLFINPHAVGKTGSHRDSGKRRLHLCNPHNALMKMPTPLRIDTLLKVVAARRGTFSKRAGYPLPALRHASTKLTLLQRST